MDVDAAFKSEVELSERRAIGGGRSEMVRCKEIRVCGEGAELGRQEVFGGDAETSGVVKGKGETARGGLQVVRVECSGTATSMGASVVESKGRKVGGKLEDTAAYAGECRVKRVEVGA